jgi:multicomponent Na+:H+ antiporter subunit A
MVAVWAIALGFVAAAVSPLATRLLGRHAGRGLTLLPLGLFILLLAQAPAVLRGEAPAARLDWVPSLGISLSFRLDGLGLWMGLLRGEGLTSAGSSPGCWSSRPRCWDGSWRRT